jgi:hypothetical protein
MFLVNPGIILEDYVEHFLTKVRLSDTIMIWTYETMMEKSKEERFENVREYIDN